MSAELTRDTIADIRRVVDKADITRQAVELMRSGVPEDAAFYWAVPVAYALQAATRRAGAAHLWVGDHGVATGGNVERSAGAAPIDVERLAQALDVLSEDGGYDLMAPEEREERFDAAERLAAEYVRLSEGTDR